MRVPGLHARLRSEGRPGEPVETSSVELAIAQVELPPLVQWVADRAFERCARLSVSPDDVVRVIERDPPVHRPAWLDDEEL